MANVIVGCKLPNGLHIEVNGKTVTLNGTNSSTVIGGYGMTTVDKDFMDAWFAAHKDFPAVRNGFIFAHSNEASAKSEAKEMADEKNGLEGINPDDKHDKRAAGVKKADKE